ncbi:MAG: DUF350 domain-containing protein, partial [Spirochaetes bacterium]|nr:DUF350 domain-containing protein [Spirochaetota bacterium]
MVINIQLVLQGLIEIGLSFLTGLLIFFISFKVFTVLTRDIDELAELKKNNSAIAILVASFIFGIMLLVKAAIGPAMDTLGNTMNAQNASISMVGFAIIRVAVIYIIASVFAFIILWFSMKLFMILTTEIDEMEEIKNNNSAISIVIAVLIISLAIILSHPLTTLLNGMVAPPLVSESLRQPFVNMDVLLEGLIELGISIIAAIFIFFFAFKVFSVLTKKIDEIEELKSNNIAIAILVSAFIFAMMLLIKAALMPANDALGH